MDLRQLQQFVAVAEELHFGRAADRLDMTQPPLSQAVLRLESEIGLQLFDRNKRSVSLTAEGKDWLEHVYRVLADADRLRATAKNLAEGRAGSLTLSFVSISSFGFLPELLRNYKSEFPAVDLVLREATSDVQVTEIINKRCDVGIVIMSNQIPANRNICWSQLTKERLMIAVPTALVDSGHIILLHNKVRIEQLNNIPIITVPRHTAPALYDSIEQYYHRNGINPKVAQKANQMQTVVSLVSAGMGVAIVPESLRSFQRKGVSYFDLEAVSPVIETALIWRRGPTTSAIKSFIDAARSFKWASGGVRPHSPISMTTTSAQPSAR